MQLLEAEFTNWCQIEHRLIRFGQSHIILGENDTGKSNAIRGILWAIDLTRGKSAYGGDRSIRGPGADSATVRVKFKEGDLFHEIERTVRRNGKGSVVVTKMDGVEKSLTEAATVWTDEWHLPHPEQVISLAYLPQQRIDLLVRESSAVREERLGKLKGLQKIKTKAAELKKKKDAIRDAKDLLAAEGIISIGKESEREDLLPRIEDQQKRSEEADQLLIPAEERARMEDALVESGLQSEEATRSTQLDALPAWVKTTWLPQFEKSLDDPDGTPITAGETIRAIQESIEGDAHNRQIKTKKIQKDLLEKAIPAPRAAWSVLRAALEKKERHAQLVVDKDMEGEIPSEKDIADWEAASVLAKLKPEALAAQTAIQGESAGGAYPFDDCVETLQFEMGRTTMPPLCPISNQPFSKDQFEAGKTALRNRRSISEKNGTVARIVDLAKKTPRLAQEKGPLAIIKVILEAAESLTQDRKEWIRRKADAATVRNAAASATDAEREAVEAWAPWAKLDDDGRAKVVQQGRKFESLEVEILNAGPEKKGTADRFDSADQEETLKDLERTCRNIHGTTFKTTREQAKTALKAGANVIRLKLQSETANAATAASLKTGLENMRSQLTRLDAEIAAIKTRRALHDVKAEEEDSYDEAIHFLQPGEGPRELIRQDLEDAIDEVNDRIAKMGIDLVLACDQELTIFAGSEKAMEDPDYRREGELLGFGLGAIAGACLQAAFLKQHNDSVENGKIEFLILDEPTATVDLWKKPGFYQGFTQGEHAVPGVIMVEHGLQCEGFFAGRTVMQRNGDQTPSELVENDQIR